MVEASITAGRVSRVWVSGGMSKRMKEPKETMHGAMIIGEGDWAKGGKKKKKVLPVRKKRERTLYGIQK